ncbi:MAG: CRISPR-associated endonuclease Cas1 [Thermoleophilaceae bacterium]|nr:CRISPR-associated endonuclease Cas1 [Thermoleophilaceae bacterium]
MTGHLLTEPIPARIINEHAYCPRLAYLMWVDGANGDNAATLEGTYVHRNVDRWTAQRTEEHPAAVRSMSLGDPALGVVAKIDLVELDGDRAVPVEYKRGSPWREDAPLRDPELQQLLAHVALLRAHGYRVDRAEVWFDAARRRVRVPLPDDLEERVRRSVAEIRENAARGEAPPPLQDDPRCPHCVLVGLCLPDEHAIERAERSRSARLIAKDTPARPLHLTEPDVVLGKAGGRLELRRGGEALDSVRAIDVSHVVVYGNATVTSAAVRAVTEAGGTVAWCSSSGWPRAYAAPIRKADTRRRIAQYRAHLVGALEICRAFVAGKLRNQRTLLRRLGDPAVGSAGALLQSGIAAAREAADLPSLRGVEGAASRGYFEAFGSMLKRALGPFDFNGRNRRPPRDPVNALLSFAYALLVRDATVALIAAGLDPYVGLLHRPGFARPALALDLMEEFRPLVGDSTVVRAINNGEIDERDFVVSRTAAALTRAGRRKFIASYERRMADEIRHPLFGYRVSYRRCLELQARMLASVLLGELPAYRPLTTR